MLLQAIDLKDFSSVLDLDGDIDEIDIVDYAVEVHQLIENVGVSSKKKSCLQLTKKLVEENKKSYYLVCFY
ncbi:hypothetical protein [Lachnobacterium bovis]|uniref:hypothetical protein n=1 Tax=Lachnobacterium bovis TaxID=140626 RepID=UPI00048AF06E|nr:hypothetical protein [Lachnobacterium bovis]